MLDRGQDDGRTTDLGPDAVSSTASRRGHDFDTAFRSRPWPRGIEDHQVTPLLLELSQGAKVMILRLQREAHDPLIGRFCAPREATISGVSTSSSIKGLARFRNLLPLDTDRTIIARGGDSDQSIAADKLILGRLMHLARS